MSVKLNIGKKITRLEIMKLNHKKTYHVSKCIELMFKGELQLFAKGKLSTQVLARN